MEDFLRYGKALKQVDSWAEFVQWFEWLPLPLQIILGLGAFGLSVFIFLATITFFGDALNRH